MYAQTRLVVPEPPCLVSDWTRCMWYIGVKMGNFWEKNYFFQEFKFMVNSTLFVKPSFKVTVWGVHCMYKRNTSHFTLFTVFFIVSFRAFAKPPKQVQMVCECIVVLKGIREVSWKSAKGMMAEAGFLKSLFEMDVDGISQTQVSDRIMVWLLFVKIHPGIT